GRFALAIDGDVSGVQPAGDRAVLLDGFGGGGGHASLQAQKINVAAAVQRQREHFLRIDHVAELGVFGIDAHGIGGNADLFRHGTDVQRNVELVLIVHLNSDV